MEPFESIFIVGNEEIVHLLLRNKANPKILNTSGKSAKDNASNKGNWKKTWHEVSHNL